MFANILLFFVHPEHSYTNEMLHLRSYSEGRIDYLHRGGTKVQIVQVLGNAVPVNVKYYFSDFATNPHLGVLGEHGGVSLCIEVHRRQ
jgi:hypothetical protein